MGPSPGKEEEQTVCPSLGHNRGSRGEEEEEQTSGAESGAGGGATSGSKSEASLWQSRRRGGGANQWVQVRGITVALGEETRRRRGGETPVGPSPGHHCGSRGGEEEEQTSGYKIGAGEGETRGSESWASPWQPGVGKRRRSKAVGLSLGQEEEQPVCPSLGHHRHSQGEKEEEQTSGSESEAGGEATSGSKSWASPWQPGRRGGAATSGSKSQASPWQSRRRGGGANQWVQVRGRRRSNQCF